MNNVQIVTITKGGNVVATFVTYDDFGTASYLAGAMLDSLVDYHGGDDWDYAITAAPYVHSLTSPHQLRQHILSKTAI
jgi:hypothetical protein